MLDGLCEIAAGLSYRRLKGIEFNDPQIDRLDTVACQDRLIEAAPAEDPPMDLGMEGLDATPKDLGETGVVGHLDHSDAGTAKGSPPPRGGVDLSPRLNEVSCQLNDPLFIRNADQCPFYHSL